MSTLPPGDWSTLFERRMDDMQRRERQEWVYHGRAMFCLGYVGGAMFVGGIWLAHFLCSP